MTQSERQCRRDPDLSARHDGRPTRFKHCLIQFAESPLSALVKRATQFGQSDPPRSSLQEPGTDALFQALYVLADYGARKFKAIGGGRKTAADRHLARK